VRRDTEPCALPDLSSRRSLGGRGIGLM